MVKFTLTHEIDCAPETFWKIFFDQEFNQQLHTQVRDFSAYTTVEQRENEQEIYRKIQGVPKLNLSEPVAKLLGAAISFVEEGTFNKATQIWHWKMTPSVMHDKIRNEGTVRVESTGDGKCSRLTEVEIEAQVFGVGGMIESNGENHMREGSEQGAAFMNQWIKDGKAK
jgi:hypothetical protein